MKTNKQMKADQKDKCMDILNEEKGKKVNKVNKRKRKKNLGK